MGTFKFTPSLPDTEFYGSDSVAVFNFSGGASLGNDAVC
jgi:hypothetical protein